MNGISMHWMLIWFFFYFFHSILSDPFHKKLVYAKKYICKIGLLFSNDNDYQY